MTKTAPNIERETAALFAGTQELNRERVRQTDRFSEQAADLIRENGNRTTNRALFMLAVHRILPPDSYSVSPSVKEKQVIDTYDNIDAFTNSAVGKVVARVLRDGRQTWFDKIGYLPHNPSGPLLEYGLNDFTFKLSGWIWMNVSGHQVYSQSGQRQEADSGKSSLFVGFVESDADSEAGRISDLTSDYTVGINEIYAQGRHDYKHRDNDDVFKVALEQATQAFPSNIR